MPKGVMHLLPFKSWYQPIVEIFVDMKKSLILICVLIKKRGIIHFKCLFLFQRGICKEGRRRRNGLLESSRCKTDMGGQDGFVSPEKKLTIKSLLRQIGGSLPNQLYHQIVNTSGYFVIMRFV